MVSSGRSNPTASQQMANIANNKQNQNQSAQKARDYYNSITKTTDAYINQPITVNSAADAKNAEVNRKRNEQLADIKKQADAIMNDSSLSAKEKAFQLGSLNSSTYGTISKAYADTNNMNAALNVSDAINNVVNRVQSIPTFNVVDSSAAAPTVNSPKRTETMAGNTSKEQYAQYLKDGYITYYDNNGTITRISETEFKDGLLQGQQEDILRSAQEYKNNTTPGYVGNQGGGDYTYKKGGNGRDVFGGKW